MKLFKQHISVKRSLTAQQSHKPILTLLKRLLVTLLIAVFFATPLVSAKGAATVNLSQSAQQVWQRQQVLITLEVITDDPFARLEVDTFIQDGFSIMPFDLQRVESNKQTTLTLKWAVFPFVAGKHTLKLPRIRYRPNSGRMQTLELVAPFLTVRRLPLYVPPTMPVGKISLKNDWKEGWLVTTNNLLEWQVIVEGKGVAKQFMPPLSRQLSSTEAVEILPLQKLDQTLKADKGGITNKRHYTIPLKIPHSGFARLPEIDIQYFEPISGKLKKARLTPPFFIALNKGLLVFISLLFIAVFSAFLLLLITKIKQILRIKQKQKQALQQLSRAVNYSQIRAALNQYALAKGWGDNLALKELPLLEAQDSDKKILLEKTINKLQAQQFSQQFGDIAIADIRNDLLQYLK